MKVISFNESPIKDGGNATLIRHVLDELEKEGIETETVHIRGKSIHGCTACMICIDNMDKKCVIVNDIVNAYIEKMIEADGIILASPTYFGELTPEPKALIDRAGLVARADGGLFKRKAGAAIVSVRRAGSIHVFDSINHLFTATQMIIPGSTGWNVGIGLAEGDVEKDEEGIRTMQTLGQNMAWY
jgi:multimeric flavodoxin WrbA